jgi:hypothetical protein
MGASLLDVQHHTMKEFMTPAAILYFYGEAD